MTALGQPYNVLFFLGGPLENLLHIEGVGGRGRTLASKKPIPRIKGTKDHYMIVDKELGIPRESRSPHHTSTIALDKMFHAVSFDHTPKVCCCVSTRLEESGLKQLRVVQPC